MARVRGSIVVKLDLMTECLFKLIMASTVSFAFRQGQLFIVKLDISDPDVVERYRAGDTSFPHGKSTLLVRDGDRIETNGRFYVVNKVTRSTAEKLVFVEAVSVSNAAKIEAPVGAAP